MADTDLNQFRQCSNPACRLRFPAAQSEPRAAICPLCTAPTVVVAAAPQEHTPHPDPSPTRPIVAILDNLRSTLNVGSIFRSADGAGVSHLYLCGITATPDQHKVAKTALGAERSVSWSYHRNALDLVLALKEQGIELWGVERTHSSVDLMGCRVDSAEAPLGLIVGNERAGVDPALLQQCHRVVHIPMRGDKRSLNVAVAFGIVAYWCAHPVTRAARTHPTS